jgi:FtsH-binding integral membrane protein
MLRIYNYMGLGLVITGIVAASTRAPSRSVSQAWKLRFARSIARIRTGVIYITSVSATMALGAHTRMPAGGGITSSVRQVDAGSAKSPTSRFADVWLIRAQQ